MAVAALSIEEASDDLHQLAHLSEEARIGVAAVCAANLANEALAEECERRLPTFFADDSPAVRKAAGDCWINLEPDQIVARGNLIGAFVRTMRSDDDASILAHKLREAHRSLPAEVCDFAERWIETSGTRASSFQFREGGVANNLSQIMVRLYEETFDDALRTRALNAIDDMVRVGFLGIDETAERKVSQLIGQ